MASRRPGSGGRVTSPCTASAAFLRARSPLRSASAPSHHLLQPNASTALAPPRGDGAQRNFTIGGSCGVPTTAKAVSLNLAVTGMTSGGFVTLWPSGLARPTVSSINVTGSETALANGAIDGLSTSSQDLSVYNG